MIVDLNHRVALIKKQACFAQFSENETEMLADIFEEQKIPAGVTIVTEGEPVDSVFLIVSGSAEVRHVTFENNIEKIESVTTLNAKTGDSIGLNETGFYSLSGLRTATVVAITDMLLLRLAVALFNGFALANSHVNEVMRNQFNKMKIAPPE